MVHNGQSRANEAAKAFQIQLGGTNLTRFRKCRLGDTQKLEDAGLSGGGGNTRCSTSSLRLSLVISCCGESVLPHYTNATANGEARCFAAALFWACEEVLFCEHTA